ncbi:MAG: type II toxin-antitoxin system RelE family toxin [Thermoanaerobaculia bacterium]
MGRVEWAKEAVKTLSRLDQPTQKRVIAALDDLAENYRGDVRRLEGSKEDAYRLRVGGWRIIFTYQADMKILVHRIRPRDDVYKR